MRRFIIQLSPVVLALALLTGCSSGSPSGSASPSPTAMTNEQILAIGREAARCMREHGVPDFPDPVVDQQGHLQLPHDASGARAKQELESNPEAQRVCEPVLDRLPQSGRGASNGPVTQEDLANLVKFAQCVRQNGVPEWPDPKPDGSFPIMGTPLATEGKSARLVGAWQACKQYWDKGIVGS